MKEFRFRIIIILGAIALSIYLLYPTYADYDYSQEINQEITSIKDSISTADPLISNEKLDQILTAKEDSIRVSDPAIREAREKRIKLGLDLQGGMYLVMEVNTARLLERLAKDPDLTFNELLLAAEEEAKISDLDLVSILARKFQERGIRLSRYFGTIRQSDSDITDQLQQQESDAVNRAIEIINNRVNQYGVSEPSIQKQGARRIVVELPGIAKEEEAKRLLQGRALLELKMVKDADFTIPILNRIDELLAGSTVDSNKTVQDTSAAQLTPEEFAKQHPFFSIALINPQSPYADAFVKEMDRAKIINYLNRNEVKRVIPDNVEFVFSARSEVVQDGENIYRLYLINKQAELSGGVITDAKATIDPQTSAPIVTFQMNSEGARDWARITGSNVDKRCAIVLDGVIYSAPVIQNKILGGNSQIQGIGNLDEAKLMEIVLKAGALPAPIDIMEERTVGPSLGQDSVRQGFSSLLLGYLIVAVFMIFYYKKGGNIADIGLFMTILLILGVLAGFNATLTLPGIAGIV
ncbi:MAG: protein-export membrane protein SecD, partial [Ignavibacteria bacterium RBG_13_36_8]